MSRPSDDQSIADLREIMRRLRDPHGGCPWDLEQDFDSIAPYTVEEAYEVADAIARRNFDDLKDELGDLLFQVVYHAQMASEAGLFNFDDAVAAICDKLVRRHPHVFAAADITSSEEQTESWEQHKRRERDAGGATSILDGVGAGLPPLQRALKLQRRAATVGFDWPCPEPVWTKIDEEIGELREAVADRDAAATEDEFGDLLFACLNLARHLKLDPDQSLAQANRKFEHRFRALEEIAGERGLDLEQMDIEAMEDLWQEVKAAQGAVS